MISEKRRLLQIVAIIICGISSSSCFQCQVFVISQFHKKGESGCWIQGRFMENSAQEERQPRIVGPSMVSEMEWQEWNRFAVCWNAAGACCTCAVKLKLSKNDTSPYTAIYMSVTSLISWQLTHGSNTAELSSHCPLEFINLTVLRLRHDLLLLWLVYYTLDKQYKV
jgi:ferredoxin